MYIRICYCKLTNKKAHKIKQLFLSLLLAAASWLIYWLSVRVYSLWLCWLSPLNFQKKNLVKNYFFSFLSPPDFLDQKYHRLFHFHHFSKKTYHTVWPLTKAPLTTPFDTPFAIPFLPYPFVIPLTWPFVLPLCVSFKRAFGSKVFGLGVLFPSSSSACKIKEHNHLRF